MLASSLCWCCQGRLIYQKKSESLVLCMSFKYIHFDKNLFLFYFFRPLPGLAALQLCRTRSAPIPGCPTGSVHLVSSVHSYLWTLSNICRQNFSTADFPQLLSMISWFIVLFLYFCPSLLHPVIYLVFFLSTTFSLLPAAFQIIKPRVFEMIKKTDMYFICMWNAFPIIYILSHLPFLVDFSNRPNICLLYYCTNAHCRPRICGGRSLKLEWQQQQCQPCAKEELRTPPSCCLTCERSATLTVDQYNI